MTRSEARDQKREREGPADVTAESETSRLNVDRHRDAALIPEEMALCIALGGECAKRTKLGRISGHR